MDNPYSSPSATIAEGARPQAPPMHPVFVVAFGLWSLIPVSLASFCIGNAQPMSVYLQCLAVVCVVGFACTLARSRLGYVVVLLTLASAWAPALGVVLWLTGAVPVGHPPDDMPYPAAGAALFVGLWFLPVSCLLGYALFFGYRILRSVSSSAADEAAALPTEGNR